MITAIYCRVSTDNQESEGSSLQTQLQACLEYCQENEYQVAYQFNEAYSGLTLDRPRLNELRDLIRDGEVGNLVVFCLDRLSRDPTHGVILQEELEKHHVTLEAVTEDIDTSELGKLISYIRSCQHNLKLSRLQMAQRQDRKAGKIETEIERTGRKNPTEGRKNAIKGLQNGLNKRLAIGRFLLSISDDDFGDITRSFDDK